MTAGDLPGASAPPGAIDGKRRRRTDVALLLAVIVLLAASLIFPWWSEIESFDGSRWVQEYSPITGVTGTCTPQCPEFFTGPPLGPIDGRESFSTAGLHQTSLLYTVSLGLVIAGLAFAVAVLVQGRAFATSGVLRRRRVTTVLLVLSLGGLAAGTALLPLFQSEALRDDTIGAFSSNSVWTASPSPETSFWGSCVAGTYNGLCASGGSAEWGPGLGWLLLLAALVLLTLLAVRTVRGGAAVPGSAPAPSSEPAHGPASEPEPAS